MLKNKYIENEHNNIDFNLKDELEIPINIYNNTKHTTTEFTPHFIFNCNNQKIYDIVKSKTINSQKYKTSNNIIMKTNWIYYVKI